MRETQKTNELRLSRILQLATDSIGVVRSVSLKLKSNSCWTATLKMEEHDHFEIIAVTDKNATEATKGLKNRLKKIIKRYNEV